MRKIVTTYDATGAITSVAAQEIANLATMATDGFMVGHDGRSRPIPARMVLHDLTDPLASELTGFGRDGKYRVKLADKSVIAVAGWTPRLPELTAVSEPGVEIT